MATRFIPTGYGTIQVITDYGNQGEFTEAEAKSQFGYTGLLEDPRTVQAAAPTAALTAPPQISDLQRAQQRWDAGFRGDPGQPFLNPYPVGSPQNPAPQAPPQAPQAPPASVTPPAGTNAPTGYQGGSIVDFLKSTGKPTDFASRTAMAKQMGIQGYRGTAQQNTQMLQQLRAQPTAPPQTQQQPQGGGQTPQGQGFVPDVTPRTTGVSPTGVPIGEGAQQQPQEQPVDPDAEIKSVFQMMGMQMPSQAQSPVSSVSDIYKQYQDMTNIFGMKKDIEEMINKKTQEISNVNENPWMSEGLRQRKLAAIDAKYDTRLSMLQSTFARADEDARFLTGKYLEQVHQTQQDKERILFKGIDLAEKEITARRLGARDIEKRREFDVQELRREGRDIERDREFESKESRLGKEFAENQARLRYEFDKREADKAKKKQKVSDHQLNQKIQHIFDAKSKGESADDLKKEIDEAVITDEMKGYLKKKVDSIYGVSKGDGVSKGGGFTFGKLGRKLDSLFRYDE